jgi:two-component system, NtrC family, response regulator AtoC
MKLSSVLIIDDEESLRHMLSILLKKAGYEPSAVPSAHEGLQAIAAERYDLVLCDVRMKEMDGFAFLRALEELEDAPTVVMMSAYGSLETAIACMKAGAYDYISKPFNADEIILTIRKIEERAALLQENSQLRSRVAQQRSPGFIVRNARMEEVLATSEKVAAYKTTILITGESGTGKEILARSIHTGSGRNPDGFVAVNCGAIPEELLESELFGHLRGAFTGAVHDKRGLFHEAHGGTLFLDEIADLPLNLQVKLLRVLQEGEIRRVGSNRQEAVDVRVIAATNRDLRQDVQDGRFREDLFYRLNVIHLHLPPLRERPEDIPPLAELFLEKHIRRTGKAAMGFAPAALRMLSEYRWPGNVRELENCVERAVVLAENEVISAADLPAQLTRQPVEGVIIDADNLSIKQASEILERTLIRRALEKTGGNRTRAAKILEISHRALLYKLKAYGLSDFEKDRAPSLAGT